MNLKHLNKSFYSYVLFSVFSVLAFILVSISAVDLNKQTNKFVKAETVSNKLWIGDTQGNLKGCDAAGSCTSFGNKGLQILSMVGFANKIWLSQLDGTLKACDATGVCTSYGDQGTFAYNMAENSGSLWIGENDGTLISCNSLGVCLSYGSKGNGINAIVSFSDKIWIGQNDGRLQSCDAVGSCTDYGIKVASSSSYASRLTGIISIKVFADQLWIGTERGELLSCDTSGNCSNHGDLGYYWHDMAIFNDKLWFITSDGYLFACDSNASCTNYGRKVSNTTNFSITTFDDGLWFGASSHLYSCDTAGVCTDYGDKGGIVIQDMATDSMSEANITCTDTDSGKNIYAKGTVNGLSASGGAVEYIDECFDGVNYGDGYKYVVEWSCDADGQHVVGDHYRCPNGCADGACVLLSDSCNVVDNGKARCFVNGNDVNIAAKVYSQKCTNNLWSNIELCTNGCSNGSCVSASSGGGGGGGGSTTYTCTDSDGGSNYYEKGYAISTKDNYKFYDSCGAGVAGSSTLVEIICNSSGISTSETFVCPNGCSDGACLKNSQNQTEKKVTICHIPPGNANNKKTIEVGESAVKALLDQGSYLGKCIEDQNKTDNNAASSTIKQNAASSTENKKIDNEITIINSNAKDLKDNKIDELLAVIKVLRDQVKEQFTQIQYLQKLTSGDKNISDTAKDAINSFITYGVDDNTKKLGAGERAAVMYSYKEAYNKLPASETELADAIKIANGRWPGETSSNAEIKAKENFIKVYQHVADMTDAKDNAAVTVMAYGLRQKAENRNLDSESQGLKTIKEIYGHTPNTTEEWNILQAITYSGATRGTDSDNDLLTDSQEKKLGTDPKKSDTDGDGYSDGMEVNSKYNPKGEGKL
jgi:hypothetical protein